MTPRTWVSDHQGQELAEEIIYQDVQQNIVNIFIITFLSVVLGFVFLGLIFLILLKCVHYFRQVKSPLALKKVIFNGNVYDFTSDIFKMLWFPSEQ